MRYYFGCVLCGAVIVFVEKASHISSGGIGGLSIAFNHFSHISVGVINIILKLAIFGIVALVGGRRVAMWTVVSTFLMGLSIWVFEFIPFPIIWPQWLAFLVLVTIGQSPTGLLISKGYSTGGFSSIAQVFSQSRRVPIWLTMLLLNGVVVLAMYAAFGRVSGLLTLFATIWQGFSIQLWTKWIRQWIGGEVVYSSKATDVS